MKQKPTKPVKPAKDYPSVSHGGQIAARGRRKANKMTDTQREDYFRRGMVLIYGGENTETAVTGQEEIIKIT